MSRLVDRRPTVVSVGARAFAESLRTQGAVVADVDWAPPHPGSEDALAALAADERVDAANTAVIQRFTSAVPRLVGVRPASDVIDLDRSTLLHAGPPLDWASAAGPLRGALVGAALAEGLADDTARAERMLAHGDIALASCHDHGAVGPMAGVIAASMPLLVVEDAATGRQAAAPLNEGLGKVLRYGAYGDAVTARLHWMRDVLGPALHRAVCAQPPIDVNGVIARALEMGDECHNRNHATSHLLLGQLAPAIVTSSTSSEAADVLSFIAANPLFGLNFVMAAAKLTADAAQGVARSTIVVAMARNGTEFGIRVAGTGSQWFTGPAPAIDGMYLGDFSDSDAALDIGDSTIVETIGLGGLAMAASPAVTRIVGGSTADAVRATHAMYEITAAEHPTFRIPSLDQRGVPLGIDIRRVVRTGVVPVINTGIAGRIPGTGQIGAGMVQPPIACFTRALDALHVTRDGQ